MDHWYEQASLGVDGDSDICLFRNDNGGVAVIQRAFKRGWARSAIALSLTTKSVKLGTVTPSASTALNWRRRPTRCVASIVVDKVTGAVVRQLSIIRSAMIRRIGLTECGESRPHLTLPRSYGFEDVDFPDPTRYATATELGPIDSASRATRRASGELVGLADKWFFAIPGGRALSEPG